MSTPENGRQLSIPLLVSLLLNAMLIGILATQWFHAGNDHSGGHRMPAGLPSIHGLSRELDAEGRSDLRQRFRANREAIRAAMQAARESRRRVATALQADPFDGTELADAFSSQRQADMAVAAAIQAVLIDFADAHTHSERKALMRAMSREHRDRGERRPSRRDAGKSSGKERATEDPSRSDSR